MIKRALTSLFLTLLAAPAIPAFAYDFIVDNIAYNIEEGNAVVTYNGRYSSGSYRQAEIVIPEQVTYKDVTYPVTAIGSAAFYQCYMLESITIPATIGEIRANAFQSCRQLSAISLPSSVTAIGNYAFQGCEGLKSLSLSCRQFGTSALSGLYALEHIEGPDATADGKCLIIDGTLVLFAPAGTKEYAIPSTVHTLDAYGFDRNTELERITLPPSLTTLRCGFSGCSSLTTAVVEDIDSYCHISYNNSYTPIFSATTNLVDSNGNPIQDIVFPGDIKTLKNYLFKGLAIRSLTIEEGVEEIEYNALRDCKYLTSVSIPSSVSKIGNAAFRGCFRLKDLTYGAANATAGYHVKEDREDEHSYIFTDCQSLTHVELLNSVISIPDYLFAQSYIKSINFPASVQNIGECVFYLGKLEEAMFEGAPELKAVFNSCSNLLKVSAKSATPPAAPAYLGTVSSASLYVPENAIGLYSDAPGWSNFKSILSEPLPGLAGHIFENNGLRFEITDPENHTCKVTSPEAGKDYPEKVVIPEAVVTDNGITYRVTSIADAAFTFTSNVTSIKIPNTISAISGINNSTTGLKEIIVEPDNPDYSTIDGVLFNKDVGNLLVYPAAKPGPYTVPSTVRSVGSELASKVNLDSLTISDSVEGALYMSNSPALKYLKMGAGITSFTVANCPELQYLEIGSGVESVRGEDFGAGYHDLWDTRNIRSLVFADSDGPIKIYTMSVDDGYIEAIPTGNCKYVYIGRNLEAAGSPLKSHFSSPVQHVEFGSKVTRLNAQLLTCMQYTTNKITVPSVDFWASTPRLYSGLLPNYSLFIAGKEEPDIRITSENIIERAFHNVNNIKTITTAETVRSIGSYAFNTNPSPKALIVESPDPATMSIDGYLLYNPDEVELYVPQGSKPLYQNADYWKYFSNIFERQTTDINNTSNRPLTPTTEALYDLQGHRVAPENAPHGIYIRRDRNGNTSKIKL